MVLTVDFGRDGTFDEMSQCCPYEPFPPPSSSSSSFRWYLNLPCSSHKPLLKRKASQKKYINQFHNSSKSCSQALRTGLNLISNARSLSCGLRWSPFVIMSKSERKSCARDVMPSYPLFLCLRRESSRIFLTAFAASPASLMASGRVPSTLKTRLIFTRLA